MADDSLTNPTDEELDFEALRFEALDAEASPESMGADFSDMSLEEAYRRAMEANDSVEWEINHLSPSADAEETSIQSETDAAESDLSDDDDAAPDATAAAVETSATESSEPSELPVRVTPRQVIEAALFVGGQPLTAKKLCYMLKGDYDLDFIEATIESLNAQYLDECRPYEIRLGEGGYRLVLHEEFQRLRNRVYGIGPREVKLSQEVLEILALIAYRQPLTPAEIEAFGKSNPGPVLRQLLRRELISLERDPQDRKLVRYRTTRRFLSVFGLGSLSELPQASDLIFK